MTAKVISRFFNFTFVNKTELKLLIQFIIEYSILNLEHSTLL